MSTRRKVVLSDSKGSVVVSREISDVAMQDPITYSPYGLGENGSSWGYNGAFRSQFQELYQLGNGNRAYLLNYGIMNRSDRTSPERAGINPYRYCTGNPVNFSDPTGNSESVKWRAGLGIFFGIAAIGLAIPTAGTALGLFAGEVGLTSGILGATGAALGATAVGMSSSAIRLENQVHTDKAHQQALRLSSIGFVLGITGAALSVMSLGKTVYGRFMKIGTRADMVSVIKEKKPTKKKAKTIKKQSAISSTRNSGLSNSALDWGNSVTFSFNHSEEPSILLKAEGNPQAWEMNLIELDDVSISSVSSWSSDSGYFESEMSDTVSQFSESSHHTDDSGYFLDSDWEYEDALDGPGQPMQINDIVNAIMDFDPNMSFDTAYNEAVKIRNNWNEMIDS